MSLPLGGTHSSYIGKTSLYDITMAHRLSRFGRRPFAAVITSNSFAGNVRTTSVIPSSLDLQRYISFSAQNQVATARTFSSNAGRSLNASPSYQIYGENTAFTMKCILPSFRIVGNRTVILDTKKGKGRLLFEFTPRLPPDERFAWDKAIKFALSAEEVGVLIARLSNWEPVEFARQTGGAAAQYGFHDSNDEMGRGSLQKIFRAIPAEDGSITFSIDYELDGNGGQDPPNDQEIVSELQFVFIFLL